MIISSAFFVSVELTNARESQRNKAQVDPKADRPVFGGDFSNNQSDFCYHIGPVGKGIAWFEVEGDMEWDMESVSNIDWNSVVKLKYI